MHSLEYHRSFNDFVLVGSLEVSDALFCSCTFYWIVKLLNLAILPFLESFKSRIVGCFIADFSIVLTLVILCLQVPIVPSHVLSINDSVSAEEAADEYEFAIRQLVKTRVVSVSDNSDCPKFDLILLGMGPDGHVASLFPNHSVLNEKAEWVTFITDSPKPPPERITFTLPVINSASNVAVVVTGDSKAEAVHLAIDDVGPDCPSLPARMVQPNGKLVWFLDKPAASKLDHPQQG